MPHYDRTSSSTPSFMFLLLGTLVGAVVGLMMSPKSGRENREDLRRKATEMRDKVQQGRDKAMDVAGKAAGTAQNMLEDESDMIGDMAEDAGAKPDRKR